MNKLLEALEESPVIAAVRSYEELNCALLSSVSVIFVLFGGILNIDDIIKRIKESKKLVCVHIDFVGGLKWDSDGVEFLKMKGVDGIITTKPSLVRDIKKQDIFAIQRLFMIDKRSLDTGIKSIIEERPDAVEIMPGIAFKVIKRLKEAVDIPIIAGGLVMDKNDIYDALSGGASGVSTSAKVLWNM